MKSLVEKADCTGLSRVLRGHRGSVLSLCSLGGLLLSGGRDNIIRVWDMDALVCRRTLAGHRDDVMCIAGLSLQPPTRTPVAPLTPPEPDCSQVTSDFTCRVYFQLSTLIFGMCEVGHSPAGAICLAPAPVLRTSCEHCEHCHSSTPRSSCYKATH